ncbi:MAG: ribokinase [Candidatus Dormibacteraeota bacterium]|nr:ribokinase [Candidatus Dormibacteraeota bacterium]MBO0759791.1 ribokinase [Candidatus Dormibacteraeota bacterium]
MSRIIVAGSLNQDLFCYVDHLPRRGETLASLDVHRQLGGKGFNQAVALRRLGAEVEMVGAVGGDEAGRAFEAQLDALGIGRTLLHRLEAPTGLALITVDGEGDNTIVLAPGANVALSPDMVGELPEADAIMVQGELRPATTIRALELGRGIRVVNPAPASLELSPAVALADAVVANEGEAADMGGVDRMQGMGAVPVVVTLGSRGSLLDNTLVPAPRVEVVDTTGAGDAFCAALTLALVEGRELEEAMWFANRAGAAACLRQGTSEAMPTRADVEAIGA